ncbi:MAG: GGDEF domain-containing protein [Sedimenticola sp.]
MAELSTSATGSSGSLLGYRWVTPVVLSGLLIYISFQNYLLFHTLAELFAIIVAILAAVVIWKTYPFANNHFLMYLGCGYLSIAAMDLMHTMTYKGMSLIPIVEANPATQLWISARFMEALLLLTAPLFLKRGFNRYMMSAVYAVVALALIGLILAGHFPDAYIEGKGLTSFKINCEYLIIGLLILAVGFLWSRRKLVDSRIFTLITASIILTMFAELAFTFYVSVYGLSNLVGHIFKLFSFWLIFESIVNTTLSEPIRILNNNLVKEIEVRKQVEKKLEHLATHDPLTGLYNRNVLENRIKGEMKRSARYQHPLSVMMIDIDHFKNINDSHGHEAGDDVLRYFAEMLSSSLRVTDYVARYGGEEFIVILPETSLEKARELADRMRIRISRRPIQIGDEVELYLTVSIGIAAYPEHSQASRGLLKLADEAMYDAKKAGRNQVKIFE